MSVEWKIKKAKAIKNFKDTMTQILTLEKELPKIVAIDGRVWTAEEMLREMELETDVGKENIEIWAIDIDEVVKKIETKRKSSS